LAGLLNHRCRFEKEDSHGDIRFFPDVAVDRWV